jgi:hypothetical protein
MARSNRTAGQAVATLCALALWGCAANRAQARGGGVAVDAEIVFAVDISYSMDRVEQEMQREGYVQALTSPDFLNALKSNALGKIAVAYMQWASYGDQDVVIEWTVIDGPESAAAVARKLKNAPYRRAQRTSISGAIDVAAKMFNGNGFDGARLIIDVSGDGPNNNGRVVTQARDEALAQGVTINGLPLVGIREWLGPADIKDLDIYYEDCVIGGPEAFSVTIRDTRSFVEATRSKLVREIATGPVIGPEPSLFSRTQAKEQRISCTIGESLWRQRWGN